MQWGQQTGSFAEISRVWGVEEIITISLTNSCAVFGVNDNMIMRKKIETEDDIGMKAGNNNGRYNMGGPKGIKRG